MYDIHIILYHKEQGLRIEIAFETASCISQKSPPYLVCRLVRKSKIVNH
jgi:hypothetical protein